MQIELSGAQLSLIVDGLNALQENALYENRYTCDQYINECNSRLISEVDSLLEYLLCG